MKEQWSVTDKAQAGSYTVVRTSSGREVDFKNEKEAKLAASAPYLKAALENIAMASRVAMTESNEGRVETLSMIQKMADDALRDLKFRNI